MRSSFVPLLLALSFTPALHAASPPADPNTGVTLQVQVSFPENQRPSDEIAVASALVSRLRDTFVEQGYAGSIVEATGRDTPNETAVLLKLDITEFRQRDDRADCSFRATLRTQADELSLRDYRVRGIRLVPEEQKSGSDSALLRLYRDVAGSQLVPGLASR